VTRFFVEIKCSAKGGYYPPFVEEYILKYMENIFENLDNNYIQYGQSIIHVVFDINDNIWFNASDVTKILKLASGKEHIREIVKMDQKTQLQDIKLSTSDDNTKQLRIHPHSIYLKESAFYTLILRSRMPEAIKFQEWITDIVLPSIRKYGIYRIRKSHQIELHQIFDKIDYLEKQNELLKKDLRNEKFPLGGMIYVIDHSTVDS
jgi:prophage antirepressor-like protein